MAFTNTVVQPCVPANPEGNYDIPMEPYTEVSNATYKRGAALVNSGGDLIEATSPINGTNKTAGIAMQAGQNSGVAHNPSTTSTPNAICPLLFVPAMDGQIFEATVGNAGADYAIVAADLFTAFQLTKDAGTGFWYADKAAGGGIMIIGIKNVQDIVLGTTVGARVFFKFLRAATIY